jgi:hypothetical protein
MKPKSAQFIEQVGDKDVFDVTFDTGRTFRISRSLWEGVFCFDFDDNFYRAQMGATDTAKEMQDMVRAICAALEKCRPTSFKN